MQNPEKVMNVEEIREYCLSLPLATEDFPFDESILAFRVLGKVFAMIDLDCSIEIKPTISNKNSL